MPILKNARYEKYVQKIISGLSQRQAYIEAYPNSKKWKESTVDSKASNLLKKDKVWARYAELQEKNAKTAGLTRERKKELLKRLAEDEEISPMERIKAIDVDNKMDGEYINKVDLSGSIESKQSKIDAVIEQLKGGD